MASADQNIAMMDGTYFVGRKEILDWVNGVCQTSLTKVEQTCTGAVACMILDAIYPGKVPMAKVDWSAKVDYEYVQNYKVLQKCFTTMKIDRHIEVDRLIRGKYQDNLEFMQWFKRFYELNASGAPYDAIAIRERGKGGAQYTAKFGAGGASTSGGAATSPLPMAAKRKPVTASAAARVGTRTATTTRPPGAPTAVSRTAAGGSARAAPAGNNSPSLAQAKEILDLTHDNERLTNEVGELNAMVRLSLGCAVEGDMVLMVSVSCSVGRGPCTRARLLLPEAASD
jgi:microtubule-associated protein, RP/EB family